MSPIFLIAYFLCTGADTLADPETPSTPIFRNECKDPSLNDCPDTSICVDLFYGYTCQCKPGFADKSNNPDNPGRICVPEASTALETTATISEEPVGKARTESTGQPEGGETDKTNEKLKLPEESAASPLLEQVARDDGSVKEPKPKGRVHHRAKPKETQEEKQQPQEEKKEPEQENQADTSQAALTDTFHAFDTDKDGKISLDELKAATKNNKLNLSDAEIKRMLKKADKNNDGFVTFNEFQTLMKNRQN